MALETAKLDHAGRIVIPPHIREEMGISAGAEVVLAYAEGELRAYTREQALHRLQSAVRSLISPGDSVVDELIADRQEEARRDAGD